jgi:hypothetical protein
LNNTPNTIGAFTSNLANNMDFDVIDWYLTLSRYLIYLFLDVLVKGLFGSTDEERRGGEAKHYLLC